MVRNTIDIKEYHFAFGKYRTFQGGHTYYGVSWRDDQADPETKWFHGANAVLEELKSCAEDIDFYYDDPAGQEAKLVRKYIRDVEDWIAQHSDDQAGSITTSVNC